MQKMMSRSDQHHHSIGLLAFDLIQDSRNSSADGSNAILLPEKKKKNTGDLKGRGNISKKNKNKQVPTLTLSKSKQRKLKQLEEEKKNKLLHSKSIEILEKCKIRDGMYSFMHSSGTIGKTETMREKRLRAVQFSKAGLEVPEEISSFKKENLEASVINEVASRTSFDRVQLEHDADEDSLLPVKYTEIDDCSHSVGGCLEKISDIPPQIKLPSTSENDRDKATYLLYDCKNPQPDLTTCGYSKDINSQVHAVNWSNISGQDLTVPADYTVPGQINGPIVVHVCRPSEIEEQRRDLPIIMMEQEIMEAINEHSSVILCGETGCGKTTQVPQFLYEAGFGSRNYSDRKGIIGVTQPRRIAVLATAKRVSFELGLRLGKEIGFQVRHDKMIGDGCSIKFMTDGILLREVQSDFLLRRYSVIILDEAHERSLNTDILVGMLSRVIKLREKLYMEQQEKILSGMRINPDDRITLLKLVLMSATLRVEDFISDIKLFHETPPVLEVPVRQFPVTIHFTKRTQEDYLGQAYKKAISIHKRLPQGGILVFVTGQREVLQLCKKLRKASHKLIEYKFNRNKDDAAANGLGADMKHINEAFDIESSSDQHPDRFNSYEEDYDNMEMDSSSSSTDSENENEDDSEDEECIKHEAQDKSGLILDLLSGSEGLSSLKASFEALAGDLSNANSKRDPAFPVDYVTEAFTEPTAASVGGLFVLPLYAMLPAAAQLCVFEEVPEGERLVVVATNVAETSLTIPGIKYVVDTGKVKVKNYNHSNGVAMYEVHWISKASAAQRAGRDGRTGPGHCYRLYSSAAFSKDDIFPEFSCPEISKIPVDGVVLLMKYMGIDKVANFPFPTPPETRALVEAEHCLKALQALDNQGRLTGIGKAMAQYPMSPRHSRMILTVIQILRSLPDYARANLVLGHAVAAAAALSFSNPFIMQLQGNHGAAGDTDWEEIHGVKVQDKEEKQRRKKVKVMVKEARARFCNPSSDALTIACALQLFELAENPVEFCSANSLQLKTMEEMSKLRKQLLHLIFHHSKLCPEFSWESVSLEDVEPSWRKYSNKQPLKLNEEELVGQAICAGWADRVAKRTRKASALSDKDQKVYAVRYISCAFKNAVYLHRWSSLSRSAPEFVVYTELLCTKRPYMHGVTGVKSNWLIKHAASLCSFSAPLTDPRPYYEALSDQVLCWVIPTFGQHNWQLPLHSLPIRNVTDRVSVFGFALLEGSVLPCLRSVQKFLAAPPSLILRPEALGQRRVGDLVNRLKSGTQMIDSRAMLREAWNKDPQFLYLEINNWFQHGFHDQFGKLWEQMHDEVLKEGYELFSKRAKKDGKTVK